MTVSLFTMVATWNNYFLPPLIMIKDPRLVSTHPGAEQLERPGRDRRRQPVFHLVITGSLITVVPLIAAFLLLQRYWQSGLAAGSVKE